MFLDKISQRKGKILCLGRNTKYWYLIRSFIFKILMANVFFLSRHNWFSVPSDFFYYGCRFETLIENHALSRLLFWIDHKPLSSFVFCGVHVIFTLYTTFKLFCSHGQTKRKMFLKILKGNLIAYLLQAWIAHIEWKKLMVWFYQKSYGFFFMHI